MLEKILLIVLIISLIFIFMVIIISPIFAWIIYKKIFDQRFIKEKYLKYYTAEELGLEKKSFTYKSNNGQKIQAYLYHKNNTNPLGIIIFSHGLGGGHLAYIKEINYLVELNYYVIAYDATGCGESEGDKLNGFSQGIIDLNNLIKYIRKQPEYQNFSLILCGHSWGAYNVLNADHNHIQKVIAISPFNDPANLLNFLSSKTLHFTLPLFPEYFKIIEKKRFKMYKETLISLKNTTVPCLIIHGKEDNTVIPEMSYFIFKNKLNYKENLNFFLVEERFHRPLLTKEAALYDVKMNADIAKMNNKKISEEEKENYYKNLDYDLLTQFDEKVLKEIETFLK